MKKLMYLNAIALIIVSLFSSSCEKDEVDAYVDSSSSGDSLTVDTTVVVGTDTTKIDTTVAVSDGYIDSLWNVWTTTGGAKLIGLVEIYFHKRKTTGKFDSLTFKNSWVNDYWVTGGSFEYLNEGKFVFSYEQIVSTVKEPFEDTVTISKAPLVYGDKLAVGWKNFDKLVFKPVPPRTYYCTYE